jgi:hypothetical protein
MFNEKSSVPSRIQSQKGTGCRNHIRNKYFKHFNPKIVTKLLKYDPGCLLQILDPNSFPCQIPDPGVKKHRIRVPDFFIGIPDLGSRRKKAKDPGSRCATLEEK